MTTKYGIAGEGREYESNPDPRFNKQVAEQIQKTIWNSDGTDGPVLICAPSFEDIQRMAGFPVDREGYALTQEIDEETQREEDRLYAD